MITQITRAQDAPGDAALRAMFAARKQVFIDKLQWDLPALDGRFELDQFDTPDARYLILLNPDDLRHRASARLLPTTAPHLLGDIYSHLCADGAPSGGGVWEISRFCLDPAQTPTECRDARNQLVTALADYALHHGIAAPIVGHERPAARRHDFCYRCLVHIHDAAALFTALEQVADQIPMAAQRKRPLVAPEPSAWKRKGVWVRLSIVTISLFRSLWDFYAKVPRHQATSIGVYGVTTSSGSVSTAEPN